MIRRAWELTAPGRGRIVEEALGEPGPGQLLVHAEWGALSPGSEALVFSGRVPADLSLDDSIAGMAGGVSYPLRYGYILSGVVAAAGSGLDSWRGRRVYGFHPHATAALLDATAVVPVPEGVCPEHAPLYANVETALSLHWDAAILPGETVVILGAGIVGLLTATLALRRGASLVVLVDRNTERRVWASQALGDDIRIAADTAAAREIVCDHPAAATGRYSGFDVGFELTGAPAALQELVPAMAFGGRIVLGSWYGDVPVNLDLGGRFHRARITLISSQVSTIPLPVAGRIDYERRGRIVWHLIRGLPLDGVPRRVIGLDDVGATLSACAGGEAIEPLILIRY